MEGAWVQTKKKILVGSCILVGIGIGITLAARTYMKEARKQILGDVKQEGEAIEEQEQTGKSDEHGVDEKLRKAFESACDFVSYNAVATDLFKNSTMLELYGLYKQAIYGDSTASNEVGWGITSYKNKAKAQAWTEKKGMSKTEAMQRYITTVQIEATKVDVDLNEQMSNETNKENGTSFNHSLRPATSILRDSYEDDEENGEENEDESTSDWFNMAVEGHMDQLMQMLSDEISSGSSKQVDINEQDAKFRTALHWACDKGNLQLVKFLLSMGADPNVKDSDGQTPLHYAAICEYRDVYDTLVSAGGDVNQPDSSGETPQSWVPWQVAA